MLKVDVLQESVCPKISVTADQFLSVEQCPICRSSKNQTLISKLKDSLEYSFCLDCSHMYASRRPCQKWYLDVYYATHWDKKWRLKPPLKALSKVRSVRRRAVEVVNLMTHRLGVISDDYRNAIPNFCSPVLRKGAKILDISCGYGLALAKFKDEGYDVYGTEATPHRAQYVVNNGIPCKNISVDSLTEETFNTKFDLVIANHVMEHVCEPNDFMEAIKRVVDYGKHALITIPNFFTAFHYMSFNSAGHVHCFTPRSLAMLLQKHGFFIRKVLIERQIRMLVERVEHQRIPIHVFEKEALTVEELATAIARNFFQVDSVNLREIKNGNYLYTFKNLSSETFTLNHFVERSIEADLKRIEDGNVAEVISQLKKPQEKAASLCKISYDGNGVLPVHISQPDNTPYSFWSNQFYAF